MSGRWQYKIVEFKPTLMGGLKPEEMQDELDKLGTQGWELVGITHALPANHMVAALKREA
ncbi:MAG: DUF4177 domain-containing protein [Proteobacteria bacterium]|nr:DUF4177 domain-containing protein [Pseudomonadota bacterium]